MNYDYSFRKGNARVQLTREKANTPVRVDLVKHRFLFGTNLFLVANLFRDVPSAKKEQAASCASQMAALNNYATLPFYWGRFEPTEGQPETDVILQTARYLIDLGFTLKGHPLCWHTVCADWLLAYDNKTILKKQIERIEREVSGFAGLIDIWDVVNEAVIMPVFDKYDNAVTRICNELGTVKLIKTLFDAAKAANPRARLVLNDFNVSPRYEELIERCLDAGVPIDIIGIQSHQHQGYWGQEKLLDVVRRFTRIGLPVHFTENTIISGALMPPHIVDLNDWQVDSWPSTPDGEIRQASEVSEFYKTLFASPGVEAVTTWDPADNAWLHAPAGLLREDMRAKPVYDALHQLIRAEWNTSLTCQADDNALVTFDGYKGIYKIGEMTTSID
jgi:GH35 family endo-1,4-beta-xylanase